MSYFTLGPLIPGWVSTLADNLLSTPMFRTFAARCGPEKATTPTLCESNGFHEAPLQKAEPIDTSSSRPIPMTLILLTAAVVHLPLLLMELPLKSYDTNFHIFFASHYLHHWFDPWNPKWYAGFSQTTYPPLPQQWIAVASHVFGLDLAYMAVQFVAILLLAIGVYRFSLLWVSPRAASFAALASV